MFPTLHDLSSMSLVPAFILRVLGRGHSLCSPHEEASYSRKRKVASHVCLSRSASLEASVSLSLYDESYDRMKWPLFPLSDAHQRLTSELCLAVGSSGSAPWLPLPVSWSPHTTRVESERHPFSSYELLFPTEDLRSQHSPDRRLCWTSAVRGLGT